MRLLCDGIKGIHIIYPYDLDGYLQYHIEGSVRNAHF